MRTFFLLSAAVLSLSPALAAKPKYGPAGRPKAIPLAESHTFFRGNASPDFWALIGFYVPQRNSSSCSVASVTTALNAARAKLPKTSEDRVLTQEDLLAKVRAEHWKERVSAAGYRGSRGTTLEQLGKVTLAAFQAFGFPNARVEVVHMNDREPKTRMALVAALRENERSTDDFVIANFDQKSFTDDETVGHIAPVGAFDETKGRVLILDPDRGWYEPYWVSVDDFLAGMATMDKGAKAFRGYVRIQTGR